MSVFLGSYKIDVYGGQHESETPTLQTKSVSYTPSSSAQTDTVTADAGYDGLEQVNVSVGATPSPEIEALSVTANGTYTAPSGVDGYSPVTVNVSGGGGASNFVHGEFHTNSTYGVQTIDIPYTGNGYAIMATVVVKGGAYVSGTAWYANISRYAVGVWNMTKSNMAVAPTNQTGDSENCAVVQSIFKNSTSSATNYSRNSNMSNDTYTSSNASANVYSCVVFNTSKKMSVYVQNTSYGLMKDIDYEYFIVYSE